MAKDLNTTIISGNLGADPELRYTPSGIAVANFRIASSKPFKRKDSDDWDEETTWLSITVWRDLAERVAEFFRKGSRVIVSGRLKTESWTNDAGDNRSKIVLEAFDVQPMARYGDLTDDAPAPKARAESKGMDMDDIPF